MPYTLTVNSQPHTKNPALNFSALWKTKFWEASQIQLKANIRFLIPVVIESGYKDKLQKEITSTMLNLPSEQAAAYILVKSRLNRDLKLWVFMTMIRITATCTMCSEVSASASPLQLLQSVCTNQKQLLVMLPVTKIEENLPCLKN